jgi:phosphate transport system substrate-binding protein
VVLTKIVAYSRESSSGTYEFFKDEVMDKKIMQQIFELTPGAIVQAVQTSAIGYIGLAYETKRSKTFKISYDQGTYLSHL